MQKPQRWRAGHRHTSFPKQGKASVGVARQYCGALGKRANCQVVASAEYVADEPESSRPLHWPVGGRLYLPEGWANDRERREISHVLREEIFRIKPQIALSLVDLSSEWGYHPRLWWQTPAMVSTPPSLVAQKIVRSHTCAGWRAPSGCACPRR